MWSDTLSEPAVKAVLVRPKTAQSLCNSLPDQVDVRSLQQSKTEQNIGITWASLARRLSKASLARQKWLLSIASIACQCVY